MNGRQREKMLRDEEAVLAYLREHPRSNQKEISEALGMSAWCVSMHVRYLCYDGILTFKWVEHRGKEWSVKEGC